MTSTKIEIYATIIAMFLLISIPTLYKTISNYHTRLYLTNHSLIINKATDCYYDDVCKNQKVTLKELYDNNYLEKGQMNPVTKAIYNDSSYVILKKNNSTFYPE